MAAPVFGHAFPFFQKEKGGKAIAVSFGVMIGLFTLTVFVIVPQNSIRLGCFIISAVVIYRHIIRYHDEPLQILLFGKHLLFQKH